MARCVMDMSLLSDSSGHLFSSLAASLSFPFEVPVPGGPMVCSVPKLVAGSWLG